MSDNETHHIELASDFVRYTPESKLFQNRLRELLKATEDLTQLKILFYTTP